MPYETVLYDKSGQIVTITLNRPTALNAFNPQLRADLMDALRTAESDDDVRCVILTGAGRAFSSGADVRIYNETIQQNELSDEISSPLVTPIFVRENHLSLIMGMTKPVIAAINGVAVGLGATIPVSCDLRIMAESARLAFIFVKRGIVGEFGANFLLPRLIGYGKAKELFLTGRFVEAREAKEIGLVNDVVPDDKLMQAAMEMARTIAANPPIAVKFIKRANNLSIDSSLRDVVEFENWAFATCQKSEDYKEAVRAFLEKREPKFRGR